MKPLSWYQKPSESLLCWMQLFRGSLGRGGREGVHWRLELWTVRYISFQESLWTYHRPKSKPSTSTNSWELCLGPSLFKVLYQVGPTNVAAESLWRYSWQLFILGMKQPRIYLLVMLRECGIMHCCVLPQPHFSFNVIMSSRNVIPTTLPSGAATEATGHQGDQTHVA